MATSFYLNGHLIEPHKNIIQVAETRHAIEPKVMEVLLLLVAQPGEVLSQEYIFAQVWPDSIFSSGSIRRCIALLRKVLDTEESEQSCITTHPKKGYSFNGKIAAMSLSQAKTKKWAFRHLTSAIIACLSLITVSWFWPVSTEPLKVVSTLPLTASHAAEFNGKVSPKGNEIAFLRLSETADATAQATRQLWRLDLVTHQAALVSNRNVSEFAWSVDGNRLAILERTKTGEKITLKGMNQVMAESPVQHFISGQRVSTLHWGSDNKLYYLQRNNQTLTLTALSISSEQTEHLYRFDDTFLPYEMALSLSNHNIALAGFDSAGNSAIKVFDLNSTELSDLTKLNQNRYFLTWHPKGNELMLSDGRALYQSKANGEVTELNYQNVDFLVQPQYMPDGKSLIYSKAQFDMDIAVWSAATSSSNSKEDTAIDAIINSNTIDTAAAISPDQSQIAYVSHRNGFPQLYLYQVASQTSQLIYQNQHKLLGLSDPVWHPSGKMLAFSNYEFPIFVHFDHGAYRVEEWQQPLGVVKDWYAHDNAVLTYSRKHKTAQKVNLESKKAVTLGPVPHRFLLLAPADKLLSINGKQLVLGNNTQVIAEFPDTIKRLIKLDEQRVLLQLRHGLIEYDLTQRQVIQASPLPKEITWVYGRLGSRFVVNNQSQQKDIIKLQLNRQ